MLDDSEYDCPGPAHQSVSDTLEIGAMYLLSRTRIALVVGTRPTLLCVVSWASRHSYVRLVVDGPVDVFLLVRTQVAAHFIL